MKFSEKIKSKNQQSQKNGPLLVQTGRWK